MPVTFHLRVPSPVHSVNQSSTVALREFDISPSDGVLGAQSDVEINVELCSSCVRKYNTELHVDVDDVQQRLLLLPITARHVIIYSHLN